MNNLEKEENNLLLSLQRSENLYRNARDNL